MIRMTHVVLTMGLPLLLGAFLGCGEKKHVELFHAPGVIFTEKQSLESAFEFSGKRVWMPTLDQIEELERDLPLYLTKSNHPDAGAMVASLPNYRRQYLGFIDEGHQRIYVNAFCQGHTATDERWRTEFVLVQDGGSCYFQAVYDVESKHFIQLSVNGVG